MLQLQTKKSFVAMSLWDYILLFYGPPGVGKTSFVNGLSDRTLFISTDRGTRFLEGLREEVHSEKELIEVIKALEAGQAKNYKVVCLDHVDDICSMVEDSTCRQLGITDLGDLEWSKGYKQYKKRLWALMQRLLKLNTGLVLIAHENIKTVRNNVNQVEKIMPDMGRSAWKILIPKCDLVGYCGFGKNETRIVRTMPTHHIYAKDRTRRAKPTNGCEYLDGKKFAQTFQIQKGR